MLFFGDVPRCRYKVVRRLFRVSWQGRHRLRGWLRTVPFFPWLSQVVASFLSPSLAVQWLAGCVGVATTCAHVFGGSLVRILTMKSTCLSGALRSFSLKDIAGSACAASLAFNSLIIAIAVPSCLITTAFPEALEDIVWTASNAARTLARMLVFACTGFVAGLAVFPRVPMPSLVFGGRAGRGFGYYRCILSCWHIHEWWLGVEFGGAVVTRVLAEFVRRNWLSDVLVGLWVLYKVESCCALCLLKFRRRVPDSWLSFHFMKPTSRK